VISELSHPLAVRRSVSFSEAVFNKVHEVEGIQSFLIDPDKVPTWDISIGIPIIIDPDASILRSGISKIVVDARMLKSPPTPLPIPVDMQVGVGPGFIAGMNCDAAVETQRGHTLGRVYWSGGPLPDSGIPEGDPQRVLRAPYDGTIMGLKKISEHIEVNEIIAIINDTHEIKAPIEGVIRGLLRDKSQVFRGLKIGDIDPRNDPSLCNLVSDKALAIGGGVLEALLTKEMVVL